MIRRLVTSINSVNYPGYPPSLAAHFGNMDTTIITSEVAAAMIPTESYEGVRYPDLLIAFNVDPAANIARNGYLIPEQGKPPDFVLEVASASTARHDETVKREAYAAMGVPEYWRFDPTGGRQYETRLAGDRLVDGVYVPVPIQRAGEERFWGHSEILDLDLCWEEGRLRFWDPAGQRYLPTFIEEQEARQQPEARTASEREARRQAEEAQCQAEARASQLEQELRRLRDPCSAAKAKPSRRMARRGPQDRPGSGVPGPRQHNSGCR